MAQINRPTDYFNTVLYTGNGTTGHAITGVGFSPDFIWLKNRSATSSHVLANEVVGITSGFLNSDNANAENTTTIFDSVDADGITIASTGTGQNASGNNYALWNWLANGAGSSNTDGSITSTVSANTTSGFSIVSYTGTGANATIGHGLNAECKMVIIKNRTDTVDWSVNHQRLCASLGDYTRYLTLNATSAVSGAGNVQYQNTPFTSSVFNVGTSNTTNGSGDNMIAYCFAEKQGFSKFGSYVGNGNADGSFIYTGFKPAWVVTKSSSNLTHWNCKDNKRSTFNTVDDYHKLNEPTAEDTGVSSHAMDFLSNGFKHRGNNDEVNGSGRTYIYMAFAENPLVGTNNIPATAR
jgi:hypothetical protein